MIPTGITLYQWTHCPYCAKVRVAFDRMGLQYRLRNVGADQKEVYQLLGRRQVPAIHDTLTGVKMVESDDIIAYARRTYVGEPAQPAAPHDHAARHGGTPAPAPASGHADDAIAAET